MDYNKFLNGKIKSIQPSKIRKFFDIASTMKDVISLGVGEPDFQTPWAIRKKAIDSLNHKRITYSANAGLADLRKEISAYTQTKTGLSYNPSDEIIVTVGGSESIDITIRAIVENGDEVLIPEPCFVSYAPIVELCGGTVVPVETKAEDNFKLKADVLESKITGKTKLLIFPYPNNPTGAIMEKEDIAPIAELLKKHDLLVLSDEIYAELTYGKTHYSIAQAEGMRERAILINGFSKTFAMTGWRLGYLCAPAELVSQFLKVHQYAIMCSPTISQYAAAAALKDCADDVRKMKSEYDLRRRFCIDGFNRIGLECFPPEGAFYVFPSIKSTGFSSDNFCVRLLDAEKVAVVPGTAFGVSGEGYIRVSYAYSLKHLSQAIERIERFLKK